MGPGHTIVTVLCDYGNRYQSKLFNPDFLRSKDLPVPEWIEKAPDMEIPFEPVELLRRNRPPRSCFATTPTSIPARQRSSA